MGSSGAEVSVEKLRFNWRTLRGITSALPGTGGVIRTKLEDFKVTEIPSYFPCGSGSFLYALVEKKGLNTKDLIQYLVKFGVPAKEVGVAGRKDKNAITKQWLSVPDNNEDALTGLNELTGVRILEMTKHRNKLKVGHLAGNHFEIRVRHPVDRWIDIVYENIAYIKKHGLPNYYGPQRFGRYGDNAVNGFNLLFGDLTLGDRSLSRYFINSLQSQVFNCILKRRIDLGVFDAVVSGDRAQKHDTGGMFVIRQGLEEINRAEILDISAVIPMHGKNVKISEGRAGEIETEIFNDLGFREDVFSKVSGSRRISRIRLGEVSIIPKPDGYVASFFLPKGGFGTCLIRELTKRDDVF